MATSDAISVRSKVLEILAGDPGAPYSAIGDIVGVTRERVRQIARSSGYPARQGIAKSRPEKTCKICGKTFYTKNRYCSADCGYKSRRKRAILVCRQCGNTVERRLGSIRNKSGNYFCDRACYEKWITRNEFKAGKIGKAVTGDLKSEADSKGEIFLKGKIPTSDILKIYNILLRLSERELVKINTNGFDDFRELGRAFRRKSNRQDTEVTSAISAIIDIKKHSLLFVMRLTD